MHARHYWNLAIMTAISFIAMYVLMYSMVDRFANVYPNINQLYMAALMAAPMAIIEVAIMREMYKNGAANTAVLVAAAVVMVGSFWLIRQQAAVGDVQFIKSMIPHHSGAILMCERAPIQNQRLKELCQEIIRGQQAEINRMNAILASMSAR